MVDRLEGVSLFTCSLAVPLRTQPQDCYVEAVGAVAKSSESIQLDLKPSSATELVVSGYFTLPMLGLLICKMKNTYLVAFFLFCFVITLQLLASLN